MLGAYWPARLDRSASFRPMKNPASRSFKIQKMIFKKIKNEHVHTSKILKNWAQVLKPGLGPLKRHKPHVYQINTKVLMQSTHPVALNYKTTKETLRWNIREAKVVP